MTATWSVIHTKIACEFATALYVGLLGYETFYPTYRKKRVHNHRTETVIQPLFPRYIFVQFDRDKDDWGDLLITKGVVDVLRDLSGKPHIIRDIVMDALRTRLDGPPAANDDPETLQPGQKVRLTSGPFEGWEGLFCEDAKTRVSVMLSLFGRPTKVSVDRTGIQPIS